MSEMSYLRICALDTLKSSVNSLLLETLTGEHERGGLILDDLSLYELINTSEEPEAGAALDIKVEDLHLLPRTIGTWHTHPNASANLSVGDSQTFVQWPAQIHAIVGTDGVRWYAVKNGAVINA